MPPLLSHVEDGVEVVGLQDWRVEIAPVLHTCAFEETVFAETGVGTGNS